MKFWQLGLFFSLFSIHIHGAMDVDVSSTGAILMNAETGKVLFSKNASQVLYPASCTKVAFALYAIKYHQALFNKRCVVSQNAVKAVTEAQKSKNNYGVFPSYVLETDASHMGLKAGEEMRFYDLLEGTMIVSGDDASNVIAEAMGNGSIERCVEEVNRFVSSIGCKNTHFMNPHGLHHPEHVSTAADLARLCQEAMKEPLFRKMVKMSRFERPKTNKQPAVTLQQSNRLIVKGSTFYYPPAVGIKTGYHRRAGHCLTAQAEKGGRSLLSVVLQEPTRPQIFQDTKKLFEKAFQEEKIDKTVLPKGVQSFSREIDGGSVPLQTETQEALRLSFYPSEEPETRCQLVWHKVELPLKKGEICGELLLFSDGQVVQKTKLYAANGIEPTFTYALTRRMSPTVWIIVGAVIVLALVLLLKRKR